MKILIFISLIVVPLFVGMLGFVLMGFFNTVAALSIIAVSFLRRLVMKPRSAPSIGVHDDQAA